MASSVLSTPADSLTALKQSESTAADLKEDQVSDYLKTHQDFLLRWLGDNATTEIVEQFAKILREKGMDGTPPGSAEGMRGSQSLRPSFPTFSQVARNSITSSIFRRYLDGDRTRKVSMKKDRVALKKMTEEERFMELIRDIASELDVNLLCHKILQNVSILTNSDRGSLFLVRGSRENKHLVSKLFDVTDTSTVEDAMHTERNEIKVPFGKGIVGIVAQTGKPINIKDAYSDPRFNQEIDKQTGYRTHSILSMPIVNYEGEVIGVAQIINKISGNHEFTEQDEDIFRKYLIFCGIGITNAQLFEMSVTEFKRNQLLLHLARGIFEEQTNLEKLVQKIMLDAQDLLKCEKCSVYLLEDTLEHDIARFTHAFMSRLGSYSRNNLVMAMQGINIPTPTLGNARRDPSNQREAGDGRSPPIQVKPKSPEEVTFSKAFDLCAKDGTVTVMSASDLAASKTAYIAKFVLLTQEPVNVADVAADGRFGKGPFTDPSGCEINSVLCMPIHNSDRRIIGVTQLINKLNGEPFTDNEVNIIEAFSIFTGLGIHNCQMYENACQLMAKQSVALDVLSYHATAPSEEASTLARSKIPSSDQLRLLHFDFDDIPMGDDGTLKACVRMFMDAGCINRFRVPYEVACRWLCTVKKNYRPVTYHNWRHAFNVCQTMFAILYTGGLRPLFDDLEVFTLLAACLCHDLDHRGTNNAFQVKVASPLAMLYSTSVLEHHHFDHCIMILNSEGNNIFQSLSPEDYKRAIKLMEHAILSTDLALYFKKRGDFKKLVETGEKQFVDAQKRSLLRAMMMTACDVGAITKPWRIQHQTALLVTAEFFEQGDIERSQLGEQPIPMMDRTKKDELPKMQVGFIDAICTPIYKLFATITDRLEPLYQGCENNRKKWQELSEQREAERTANQQQQQQQQQQQSGSGKTETAEEKPAEKEPVHNQAVTDQTESGQNQQPPAASNSNDNNNSNDISQKIKQAPMTAPASLDRRAPPPSEQPDNDPETPKDSEIKVSREPGQCTDSSPRVVEDKTGTGDGVSPGPKPESSFSQDHPDKDNKGHDTDAQPPSKVTPESSEPGDPAAAPSTPPSGDQQHQKPSSAQQHPPSAKSQLSPLHLPSAHSRATSAAAESALPTSRDQPDGRESLRTKPDGHSDSAASASTTYRAGQDSHQQVNGSFSAKQTRSTPSEMRHKQHNIEPATAAPPADKPSRGKRKTLAQAEQAAGEKSGGKSGGKSGVCLVS